MKALIIVLCLLPTLLISQAGQRIESEFKLGMPLETAKPLWQYLQSDTFLKKLSQDKPLTTNISVEDFVDIYYDDENHNLLFQEIGLRHRSRYINDTLIKQLIQLKTPLTADGVARTEVKYEVKNSIDKSDLLARHPLLKFIKKRDRNDLKYQLNRFKINALDLTPELSLRQTRKRIYIQDGLGSLATFTLDNVISLDFPYHQYTEMEMELNEVRYTEATDTERHKMDSFNQKMRNQILTDFPTLFQDQTPKYNKMWQLIDNSLTSTLYKNLMWAILLLLILLASYLWITRL